MIIINWIDRGFDYFFIEKKRFDYNCSKALFQYVPSLRLFVDYDIVFNRIKIRPYNMYRADGSLRSRNFCYNWSEVHPNNMRESDGFAKCKNPVGMTYIVVTDFNPFMICNCTE